VAWYRVARAPSESCVGREESGPDGVPRDGPGRGPQGHGRRELDGKPCRGVSGSGRGAVVTVAEFVRVRPGRAMHHCVTWRRVTWMPSESCVGARRARSGWSGEDLPRDRPGPVTAGSRLWREDRLSAGPGHRRNGRSGKRMSADRENHGVVVSGSDRGPPARSPGLHVWSRSEPCAAARRGCHPSLASGPEGSSTVVWAGYHGTGWAVYRRVTAAIMKGAGTRVMGAGGGPLCARRVARAWHARGQGRRGGQARGIGSCVTNFWRAGDGGGPSRVLPGPGPHAASASGHAPRGAAVPARWGVGTGRRAAPAPAMAFGWRRAVLCALGHAGVVCTRFGTGSARYPGTRH
jgi:hypothetical protein